MKIFVTQQSQGPTKGRWFWELKADSGKPLGMGSQNHATREECLKEVKAVRDALPSAKLQDRGPAPDETSAPEGRPKLAVVSGSRSCTRSQ